MVKCPTCGWVPLPEDQLPLLLPQVESYEPTDDGESPICQDHRLGQHHLPAVRRRGPARDRHHAAVGGILVVFPALYGSRTIKRLSQVRKLCKYWSPVDWYNGGMEHTTLHLLYSRFWHKFLYDEGLVPTKEPYAKRTSHGMILGEGGEKMSKSRGNVVNPNDIVEQYGADTLRVYIMFIGDFTKAAAWSSNAVAGCRRFLDRVWNLASEPLTGDEISRDNEKEIHRAIQKVSSDIDEMKFNTAIAQLMSLVNQFYSKKPTRGDIRVLLQLLSPFAPHICEELWQIQGFEGLASEAEWPEHDEAKMVDTEKTIAVQVNGKLRSTVVVPADSTVEVVSASALADKKIAGYMEGMEIVKTINVPNKLINFILKPKK